MKIGRVDIDDYLNFIEIYNDLLDELSDEFNETIIT